jgi:amino-acid N-acetyltransferase
MEGGRPAVPYLDKFAVLKRAQGSGGVADIVFNALVRVALPLGVVWRSRADNPVNKWYFERAKGTWKVSPHWTMFWTGAGMDFGEGEDATEKVRRWRDYVGVCRSVEASWADGVIKGRD